jgi:hypothetical protein
MRGAISPLPQYAFMAWCLVKHRDNFTFTFYVAVLTVTNSNKTVYDRLNIEIAGSNPVRGMDVCLRVSVLFALDWSPN